ncbi:hypothetical protein [Sandarakinorhabdus sp.]|uniref:hypothetical protein n=1 Tax=Sandarakinorhabdus sp. TaxID=1916663 RepID=UPI0028A6A5E7|nr:hypothetical protein [Sandarakinorhabdus sp.]
MIGALLLSGARTASPALLVFLAIVRRDIGPLAFSLIACGIAATVATFQFSIFTSFVDASSAAPHYLAADAWISDRGVECFDFPSPLPEGYAGTLAALLPGARFDRVVMGFTTYVSPAGQRGNVAVIGTDASGLGPREFRADISEQGRLGLRLVGGPAGTEASIGGRTVQAVGSTDQLATYLGAPYAVLRYESAHEVLNMPAETASYLMVRFAGPPPADLPERLARIEARYPELTARTGAQFNADSARYWQGKTGAGAAILLAAVLASLLMALLLVNGIGRFVQRRHDDLVSMIGHGASPAQLAILLLLIGLLLVLASLTQALVAVPMLDLVTNDWLPWVRFKSGDALFAVVVAGAAYLAAVVSANQALGRFPPDAIFRS